LEQNANRWNEEAAFRIFDDTLAETEDNTIATMEGKLSMFSPYIVYCVKFFATKPCTSDFLFIMHVSQLMPLILFTLICIVYQGISSLCDLLEIDGLEDIRILVLMWKMEVGKETPQQITRNEWKEGCEKLNLDSIEKFKRLLPHLDIGFLEATEFRDFYKVGFVIVYCPFLIQISRLKRRCAFSSI